MLQENKEDTSGGGAGDDADARSGPLANLALPGRKQLLPPQLVQLLDRVLFHSALLAAGADDLGGGGGGGEGKHDDTHKTPSRSTSSSASDASAADRTKSPSARTHPTRGARGVHVSSREHLLSSANIESKNGS